MLQSLSREEQVVSTVDVLGDGMDQLREEHELLKREMMELYGMAKVVGQDDDVLNWSVSLNYLRGKTIQFVEKMDAHSLWEDQVLFPMVRDYSGQELEHLNELEQEHKLAHGHIMSFLRMLESCSAPVNSGKAKEAAACLLEAYTVLSGHFHKEEENLFPLAEQMLTDLEQFFSC
ncbi:MAG: hemerythrin [Paenibacillaceae bacterium]|nr:hemerythrin [Paenibacillaceae bacterium]